ncbi:MAG: lysophospholipid acyltransferase family protein [Pseudomonadota bacterium]
MKIRLILLLCVSLFLLLPLALFQYILRHSHTKTAFIIPKNFHRLILKTMRIKVSIRGNIPDHGPIIFVANHWSWLDISVLGAVLDGHFVAKSEIAGWPVFGFLAKLQNTIFVSRNDRTKVGQQAGEITKRLSQKRNIILFAEGTSNDGNRVLGFKSSLFSVAKPFDDIKPLIQPVTIYYQNHYGMPLGRKKRPFLAWYGDMDLVPHVLNIFNMGPIEVVIALDNPVSYDDFASRKTLSEYVENRVRLQYNDCNSVQSIYQ